MKATEIPTADRWHNLVCKSMIHVACMARWNMVKIHADSEGNENAFDTKHSSQIQRREDKIAYLKWCGKKKIKPRFGAIGKYGSIAIIERFNRTFKDECTRRIFVPFNINDMRNEVAIFITWYNEFRPHQHLKASPPEEVYANSPPIKKIQVASNSKLPELKLHISYFEGRKHLPGIELKRAA